MDEPVPDPTAARPARFLAGVSASSRRMFAIATLAVAGWGFLAWMALDMAHPFAQLTMPASAQWTAANFAAIWTMWAVMMAAMMLPSALPMIGLFVSLNARSGDPGRAHAFVAAYLAVWLAFGTGATAVQWLLQSLGWINPMIVSTSPVLTAVLLIAAGLYQFSGLKRMCLSRCRTPMGFLLGEWRPGVRGAWSMGARHGVFCVGCCWALMALLFVGGAMNLAWIAAVSIAVALEKLLPRGERLTAPLGIALLAAGVVKLMLMPRWL